MLQSGVSVQVATVERGEIREYIDERGKTRVPRVYRITTPQAGRIEEITLAEGDAVKQGQVVAQIVSDDLENAVDEARAVVERLDAAIVENDDVAVEKSLARAGYGVRGVDEQDRRGGRGADGGQRANELSMRRRSWAASEQLQQSRASCGRRTGSSDTAVLGRTTRFSTGFADRGSHEVDPGGHGAAAADGRRLHLAQRTHAAVLEKQKSEAQARLRQIMTQRERGTMNSPVDGVVLRTFGRE